MSSILAVKMPAMPLDVQQRSALMGLGSMWDPTTVGEYVDQPVSFANAVIGATLLGSLLWVGLGYLGGRATR
jgi:hypothetical protein